MKNARKPKDAPDPAQAAEPEAPPSPGVIELFRRRRRRSRIMQILTLVMMAGSFTFFLLAMISFNQREVSSPLLAAGGLTLILTVTGKTIVGLLCRCPHCSERLAAWGYPMPGSWCIHCKKRMPQKVHLDS